MSTRASAHHCDNCNRDTPRRRLTETTEGRRVCPRCLDRLPRNLRRAARRKRA